MEWLIGKALAPFFAMFLVWAITRPASRWVQRNMGDGWIKRTLLIHSEHNKVAYAVGCFVLMSMVIGLCIWASLTVR